MCSMQCPSVYKKCLKTFIWSSILFYPWKLQPPRVMADKKSIVGFRTVSYAETKCIDVPTALIIFNVPTFPTYPQSILLMVKAKTVSFIYWNFGNIQSKPSLEPYHNFQQLFIVKKDHAMLWKIYFPITMDTITNQNYIILTCLSFYIIQLYIFILFVPLCWVSDNVWILIINPYFQPWIIYYFSLKLSVLFPCWYIVVVKGNVVGSNDQSSYSIWYSA